MIFSYMKILQSLTNFVLFETVTHFIIMQKHHAVALY